MKKIVVLCITTLILSNSYAQKIKDNQFFLPRGCIDIQAGVAVPIMDYALSKLTLPAGYANTGYAIKLGVNYDINQFFGLALQYQYINNPYNSSQLKQDLATTYTDRIFNSVTSKPWELQGLMLGIYYPFKAYKTTIDVRVMGALYTGVLPENEQNITVPSLNNNQFNFKQLATSNSNFGINFGLKMRHQLYKNILLIASAEYNYADITFKNIRTVETIRNASVSTPDYSQKFQIVTFSLGIGIGFD